jgi:hypothetical protein
LNRAATRGDNSERAARTSTTIVGKSAMYIAETFDYGHDANCVGVDGIVDCMGVFVLHNNVLYAIHQPNNFDKKTIKLGRDTFATHLEANHAYKGGGKVYVVVNCTSRGDEETKYEVQQYHKLLSAQTTKLYRITAHPGVSIAVVCERNLVGGDVTLKYTTHALAGWVVGGSARDGYYQNPSIGNSGYTTPTTGGWTVINPGSAVITLAGAAAVPQLTVLPSSNAVNVPSNTCAIM